jgi:DNA (cytosine-5)-methyltransferase 1
MESIWQAGWDLSDEKREWFRQKSINSAARKKILTSIESVSKSVRQPRLAPESLMPIMDRSEIDSVSLFSGCGGLDIGFERAGFNHLVSVDILSICGETLQANRPSWQVHSGPIDGDVRNRSWSDDISRLNKYLVLHGGPPCQPFSNAGRQLGKDDPRNMVPEFFRAIQELQPDAFVMENVPALGSSKFSSYLDSELHKQVGKSYFFKRFFLFAPHFGVPQQRNRLFVVGFRSLDAFYQFKEPAPTHSVERFINIHKSLVKYIKSAKRLVEYDELPPTMGVREAIGLDDSVLDGLAPTFRSGFTGPRNSTSILNGASSQKVLENMGLWGNGIASSREAAAAFPPENGTERLSTQDIALIQGFPEDWEIKGPVYKVIGQIGNSVAPPVAYQIARAVRNALLRPHTHSLVHESSSSVSRSLLGDDQVLGEDLSQLSFLSNHR